MCETAIQAGGKFLLRKTKDGKYRLSFTLFYDDSTSVEHLQARQILLQSFLLDLHQEKNCLDAGRVCIRNIDEVLDAAGQFYDAKTEQEFAQAHECVGDFVNFLRSIR